MHFVPELISTETLDSYDPDISREEHSGHTDIGETVDGQTVYVKKGDRFKDVNIGAGKVLDYLPVRSPVVSHGMSGEVLFENLEDYRPIEDFEDSDDIRWESYVNAAAAKYIVGDPDLSYNILANRDGRCAVVDYDFAGNTLEESGKILLKEYNSSHFELFGRELTQADMDEAAEKLLEDVPLEEIFTELESDKHLDSTLRQALKYNLDTAKKNPEHGRDIEHPFDF